jgi:hypothetical protein
MSPKLHLLIALCLCSANILAEVKTDQPDSTGVPVDAAESPGQVTPQQEEVLQQVISEGEDPQELQRSEHEEQVEELIEHQQPAEAAPEKEVPDKDRDDIRKK